jgi:small subunit ribosomal protein S18
VKKKKAATAARVAQRQAKGFQSGTTYHPDELGQPRTRQQRPRPATPSQDPFEVLGLDPLKEYKNFTLLSHFVSDIGKILPREATGKVYVVRVSMSNFYVVLITF